MAHSDSTSNAITSHRSEVKYLLSGAQAAKIRNLAMQNIVSHTFKKGRFVTFITTIYFDTKDCSFYHRAVANPKDNLKMRAREYYYFNEELIELSSSYDSLFEYSPDIWLEIKHRKDAHTSKRRLNVPKKLLVSFLAGEECKEEILGANPDDPKTTVTYEMIADKLRGKGTSSLVPSVAANYQRRAYQNEGGSLRITLDANLSFHKISPELFQMRRPLIKENLGSPMRSMKDVVLELKSTCDIPAWLREAIGPLTPVDFSKFRNSSKLAIESCPQP